MVIVDIEECINDILNTVDKKYKHVVCLDGLTGGFGSKDILRACQLWLLRNFNRRRLFVTCSMEFRMMTSSMDEDRWFGSKDFFVDPWVLKDYLKAVKNAEFFSSVREMLNSSLDEAATPAQLVKSKFHDAGGSCWLMFDCTRDEVANFSF
ncbi:unnamed protein product [Calypogeia fissa]